MPTTRDEENRARDRAAAERTGMRGMGSRKRERREGSKGGRILGYSERGNGGGTTGKGRGAEHTGCPVEAAEWEREIYTRPPKKARGGRTGRREKEVYTIVMLHQDKDTRERGEER